MIVRLPSRPKPRDPRARAVLEWAEVVFYVFCLALLAAALTLAVFGHEPPLIGSLR